MPVGERVVFHLGDGDCAVLDSYNVGDRGRN